MTDPASYIWNNYQAPDLVATLTDITKKSVRAAFNPVVSTSWTADAPNIRKVVTIDIEEIATEFEEQKRFFPRDVTGSVVFQPNGVRNVPLVWNFTSFPSKTFYPKLVAAGEAFAASVKGRLDEITLVALAPNTVLPVRATNDMFYLLRDRFNLVIECSGGSFQSGGVTYPVAPGDVFYLNSSVDRNVVNNVSTIRYVAIFTILTYKGATILKKLQDYVPSQSLDAVIALGNQ